MKKILFLAPFIFFLFSLTIVSAQTKRTVCASGCDYTTIQAAQDAAARNRIDTISIEDAVHTEAEIIIRRSLIIQGLGQHQTIVQAASTLASATDRVLIVPAAQGINLTIRDVTLRHGNGARNSFNSLGNCIYLTGGSSTNNFTFERVSFTDNGRTSDGGLGAIYIGGNDGTFKFKDCIFSNNYNSAFATFGGDTVAFDGCTFSNNTAPRRGGAIFIDGSNLFAEFTRCTFNDNTAGSSSNFPEGGAVYIESASSIFTNCTFYNNEVGTSTSPVSYGGAIHMEGGGSTTSSIINCTIVENKAYANNNTQGGGIYWNGIRLDIINSIIANNTAIEGADVYKPFGSSSIVETTTSMIEDCLNCSGTPAYTSDPNLAPVAFCGNHAYFAPQAPSDALDNGTAPTGSIPTDDICGNMRLVAHDLGSYDVESAGIPVPTLSQWALIVLALVMSLMATLALRPKLAMEKQHIRLQYLPFDFKHFSNMLCLVGLCLLLLFAIAIMGFGYSLTDADVPGCMIASPIAAYLLHLWIHPNPSQV